jgi:uncharacterized protein YkwD
MKTACTIISLVCLFAPSFPVLSASCIAGEGRVAYGEGRDMSVEKEVVELVNRMRVKGARCGGRSYKGTRPVVWNDILGKVSLEHSAAMAENRSLGHAGSDGSNAGTRLARFGYQWMTYGENIGEGHRSPEAVVKGWVESRGHCENIMNPAFKEAGAASAKAAGRIYWTLVLAAPEPSSHIRQ